MQVQDPVLQQLYDNFLEALLSEPAPSPQELMSMFSSIVNRYFDLLFPKMTDALDTFLANLTNPSSGNNTGTPGDTETSPGFHTPAGTIILETQPSKPTAPARSEEHTSELQSLMRISYAAFCLKKKKN